MGISVPLSRINQIPLMCKIKNIAMPVEVTPLNGCGPNLLEVQAAPHDKKVFPIHSVLKSVTVRLYSLLTAVEGMTSGFRLLTRCKPACPSAMLHFDRYRFRNDKPPRGNSTLKGLRSLGITQKQPEQYRMTTGKVQD
jgi:hypothetical protein